MGQARVNGDLYRGYNSDDGPVNRLIICSQTGSTVFMCVYKSEKEGVKNGFQVSGMSSWVESNAAE